jgi:hypothetical protein
MKRLSFAVALAACNGVHSNPLVHDAPVDSDIDAPVDGPPVLAAHRYIIDKEIIPQLSTEARTNALDVDGNGQVDNQLGLVMATFAEQTFDVTTGPTLDVDRGSILQLVQLEADTFTNGPARFTLFSGANPSPPPCNGGTDTVCRHHLSGSGSFTVPVGSEHDTPLAGTLTGGALLTNTNAQGKLVLHTNLASPAPVTLRLLSARVKLTSVSASGLTGIIGGGVPSTDIDDVLLPAWSQSLNTVIAKDCNGAPPTCGCTTGSVGKSMQQLFDTTPRDCTVSVAELRSSPLIQALIAPDLTVAGQQAVSLCIAFTAVAATFTP